MVRVSTMFPDLGLCILSMRVGLSTKQLEGIKMLSTACLHDRVLHAADLRCVKCQRRCQHLWYLSVLCQYSE